MITYGPKLGLMVNGDQGEEHYEPLMKLLRGLDALVQLTVQTHLQNSPPPSAANGECRIVGPTPLVGSAWEGHARKVARFNSLLGEWEFYPPRVGWIAYSLEFATHVRYRDGEWEPLVAGTAPPANARLTKVVGTGYISGPNYNIGQSNENPFYLNYAMLSGRSRNSGKRYFEMLIGNIDTAIGDTRFGVTQASVPNDLEASGFVVIQSYAGGYFQSNSEFYEGYTYTPIVAGPVDAGVLNTGDVMSVCVNLATGKIWYRINGTGPWYGGGDPGTDTGGFSTGGTGLDMVPFFYANEASRSFSLRSAAGDFSYALPSGAVAWDS